jgi:hypothetical protein
MSRNQRLGFLGIAAVIAVVAVVVFSFGGDDPQDTGNRAAQPTATPSATEAASGEETSTPTPTATPKPQPALLTGSSVKKLRFTEGETIRFRVRSDAAEEIHVHGYDVTKDVPAGETVPVSFKASITGIFEIEFHNSGTQIAELRVDPE